MAEPVRVAAVVPWERLVDFAARAYEAAGVPPHQAQDAAEAIVDADGHGTTTHGLKNLRMYITNLKEGRANPRPNIQQVGGKGNSAVFDADGSLGHVAAYVGVRKAIELAQEYGTEADWERHFAYLLPFFRDRRYIKHDGKPLLLIYRAASIPEFDGMIGFWRRRATESGLLGLHVVVTNTGYPDDRRYREHDAALDFEPHTSLIHRSFVERVRRRARASLRHAWTSLKSGFRQPQLLHVIDYDEIWGGILRRPIRDGVYPGTFVDWDNSPRRGANGPLIVKGFSMEKFAKYFGQKYLQAARAKAPFVFVNAWNEWAEGTYLEPDTRRGMGALEAILAAKGTANAPT